VSRSPDIVVVGAGSVGCPLAFFLAKEGLRVLVVESHASPGQGQNKAAIGGVRATHSDPAKIQLCLDSIKIFSAWHEEHGIDIGWKMGGYCFPAFGEREEGILKGLLGVQKSHGLDIDWMDAGAIKKLVPGIREEGLRGGTFSPGDGQVSPLRAASAFARAARELGAETRFRETVTAIRPRKGGSLEVVTDKGSVTAGTVVIAAGAEARQVGELLGIDLPVTPDSHEAGITAPVKHFLGPLVVDIRPGAEDKTANFYFGQNSEGQIIFCYTPSKLFVGTVTDSTSEFMPVLARRIVSLIPALKNLLVRRVWRGLYPMTPDGIIILDKVRQVDGVYAAVGMCGQGMMLGPGVARCLTEVIVRGRPTIAPEIYASLSLYRDFHKAKKEALK
jgi:sarcosine oxidase subunit beta